MSTKKFRFLLRNLMYLRNFEPAIRGLAARGHDITVTTSIYDRKVPAELQALADAIAAEYPNVHFGLTYERADWWGPFVRSVRSLRHLMRYREKTYATAPALAQRAERRVYPALLDVFNLAPMRSAPMVAVMKRVLKGLDAAVPADKEIVRQLRTDRPDALVVTPLVDLQSEQTDWVKAARKARVPSCLTVASWDNLTNKGLILEKPDRVVVWNEFQKDEATDMHGIPPRDVVVTGAQLYDHWFDREPSRDYASFCADFGFDASKPTILYCGSSIFIARNEAEFVLRWLEAVRGAAEDDVREANILIRPHPMHQVPYDTLDVTPFGRVAVHPRSGGMPVLENAKADYFDALYHASAVVGINTSALIEASILGKRSFTVDDPKYRKTQEGTLHFRYLTEGGILKKAPDFTAHTAQLAAELADRDAARAEVKQFVERFLRPRGIDTPATPVLVDALDALPEAKPHAWLGWAWAPLTVLMAPFAYAAHLAATMRHSVLDFTIRGLRRGLFTIAKLKNRDGIDLLALSMPVDYDKAPVSILATSPKEAVTRTRSVMKEPWTVHWIENAVKPGEVFYDIGANVGVYSLVCAAAHPDVPVYAFEPGFATYAALCRNIIHNAKGDQVTPIPVVLHEKSGSTTFKYRSLDSGAARHAVGEQGLSTKDFKDTRPVYSQGMIAISLDEATSRFGLPVPNHIKLDVDGPELEILRGAVQLLSNPQLKSVMVELDDQQNGRAIVEILESHGLKLVKQFDKQSREPSFDAFFARDVESIAKIMDASPVKPPAAA